MVIKRNTEDKVDNVPEAWVVTIDNRGKIMTSKQSNGRIKQKPKLGSPKLGRTTPAQPHNIRRE